MCICLSLWGIEPFAYYLSESTPVAILDKRLWKVSTPYLFRFHNPPTPRKSSLLLIIISMIQHIENRLVLYLLRPSKPARFYPPRHLPSLLSLSIPLHQTPLDAPLGHRRYQGAAVAGARVDILCNSLWRRAYNLFLRCGYHGDCLGVEIDESEDVFGKSSQHALA